ARETRTAAGVKRGTGVDDERLKRMDYGDPRQSLPNLWPRWLVRRFRGRHGGHLHAHRFRPPASKRRIPPPSCRRCPASAALARRANENPPTERARARRLARDDGGL